MIVQSVLPILTDGSEYKVVSPFGYRDDPFTGEPEKPHKGVDLVLWQGEYGIVSYIGAAWDGVVVKTDYDDSRGHYVVIDHGEGITTWYGHLVGDSIHVCSGETVTAGQEIGYMGRSGRVTGAHLHFQMEISGVAVDPLPYITGEEMLFEMDDAADGTKTDDWWVEPLLWAQENEIIVGDINGDLMLDEPCTRRQMVTFLHRLYKLITEGSAG